MAKLILLPTPKLRLPSRLLNDAWWLIDKPPRQTANVVTFPGFLRDGEGEPPVSISGDRERPHVRN